MVVTHRELEPSLAEKKVVVAGKDPDVERGANIYIALWHRGLAGSGASPAGRAPTRDTTAGGR